MPRPPILLLLKAGEFKHTGGFALWGNPPRWHKIHTHKPAPKGAPVAHDPQAVPAIAFVLPPDQIEQLKLPASNSNAGTFNKQLEKVLGYAASGDAAAILGMPIGVNTYGQKLAKVANYLLQGMGISQHVVAHGQVAGAHAAVTPAEAKGPIPPPVEPPPPEPIPVAAHAAQEVSDNASSSAPVNNNLTMPEFAEGKTKVGPKAFYEKIATKIIQQAEAGNVSVLQDMVNPEAKSWQGKTANSKKLLALHAAALALAGAPPSPAAATPNPHDTEVTKVLHVIPSADEKANYNVLIGTPKSAPGSKFSVIIKDGDTGEAVPAVKLFHTESEALDHAFALAEGKKSSAAAAPLAPESVATHPPVAPTPPSPYTGALTAHQLGKLQSIPWYKLKLPDSNSNAQTHNSKIAKIEAMAFAGDVAGLEAFKAGKNTYGKKQTLLAQTALAAISSQEQAPATDTIVQLAGNPYKFKKNDQAKHGWQYQHADTGEWHDVSNRGTIYELDENAPPAAAPARATKPAMELPSALVGAPPGHAGKSALASINIAKDAWGDDEGGIAAAAMDWLNANPGGKAELASALVDAGHSGVAAAMDLPVPDEDGPNDGDTKPGADGATLVFKDGRWHKVIAADEHGELPPVLVPISEPAPTGVDAVVIPVFNDGGVWDQHYTNAANELKKLAAHGGVAALKGVVINHADGRFSIIAANVKLKKVGPNDVQPRRVAMHKFITELKLAAGKPAKAKAPPKAVAPEPVETTPSIDTWQQTGPQGGSNPGGRFKDAEGVEWYCKFPANEDIAKSEILAARLYGAAGVLGQDAKLITKGGKVGIASRWVTVAKAGSPAELAKVQGAQSGFAVDAWLGNWDVVGMGFDNLQVGADGKAVRVDAGGSLEYRAQGSKKPFGDKVGEVATMRDAAVNPQAAAIFGKMTKADITASVAKVVAIGDPQIRALVEEFGPGDKAARIALANTLIARKADLLAQYPKAGKAPKKRLDPTKLPVTEAQLPQPHSFANWNSPGHGLSSKPHVNAANQAVEQQALTVALDGNLVALKEFKYHGIDKDTGNASDAPLPIAQHPSKHVVQYHADLVQALDEIANPPEALKVFAETDVGSIAALDAAFPPKAFGTTVGSVASNEKMGFWVALGAVKNAATNLRPKTVMDYTSHAIKAAEEKYKDAKHLAKHFIARVQSSGSYNDLFRDGKTHDHDGNKLSDVAQAALEHATEMPEGTTIYRWQKMTDQMLKHIMASPDGTVFQATGPMCTSYSPTATAGFGTHRVVIRYAKGAKAVESFARCKYNHGQFAGEKEVTTLPNNRYVVLSKKMVPDVEHGNANGQRLELEILMLPPDLGIPGVKG